GWRRLVFRARSFLSHPGVSPLGFFGTDESIAVGIDALKILARAQEFTRREVAVAVTVHALKPERSFTRLSGPALAICNGDDNTFRNLKRGSRLTAAQQQEELVRDVFLGDKTMAVPIPEREPCPGGFQIALTQTASVMGVQQIEQTFAMIGDHDHD